MSKQGDLFRANGRQPIHEAEAYTLAAMETHAARYPMWVVTFSGGKDSTALLTFLVWALATGRIPAPERLVVLYADTRMELPTLYASVDGVLAHLATLALPCEVEVRRVEPPMDHRWWVYILGRGVPVSHNKFRWCTSKLKLMPMRSAIVSLLAEHGADSTLVLTGVRRGESAARDERINAACNRDDGECGQGFFQVDLRDAAPTLAPIDRWRLCAVWDWLTVANLPEHGGWPTWALMEAYGGQDAAEDMGLRTGCTECALVSRDRPLITAVHNGWPHLAPLHRLAYVYERLRAPSMRHRKPYDDGDAKRQGQLGPLTMEARAWALREVRRIEADVKRLAAEQGLDYALALIDAEEEAAIRAKWAAGEYPRGWTGREPRGDAPAFAAEAPLIDLSALFSPSTP